MKNKKIKSLQKGCSKEQPFFVKNLYQSKHELTQNTAANGGPEF
jgi:hypothetical protein